MRAHRVQITLAAALLAAAPAVAQEESGKASGGSGEARAAVNTQPAIVIQNIRPQDQRGINVFEAPKNDGVPYAGFKLDWGASFTQQFQSLEHSNTAAARMVDGKDQNALMNIGTGFNNAVANLNLNAQLAPGIRVALTSYLSSRHHNETWVKDGYLQIDASPIDYAPLHRVMEYVTIKAGHYEINYGDAHFRRSDNGNGLYNPFVGNLVLDGFTTEIGTEVYVRAKALLGMVAVSGGEIKGNVLTPDDRSPAVYAKLGFDQRLTPDLRLRLTGSAYRIERSPANTLFAGDRAGSRYYFVMENQQATSSAQFTSGAINPGFRYKVETYQINPFVEYKGAEVFGVIEKAQGRGATETTDREWTQYAVEGVYRIGSNQRFFAGGRYNTARGELFGIADEVSVDRYQLGAGWFLTPSIVLKGEYVNQKYNDFPTIDIRNGGRFKGLVVEGVVSF